MVGQGTSGARVALVGADPRLVPLREALLRAGFEPVAGWAPRQPVDGVVVVLDDPGLSLVKELDDGLQARAWPVLGLVLPEGKLPSIRQGADLVLPVTCDPEVVCAQLERLLRLVVAAREVTSARTAGAVHDLNNLLTVIVSHATALNEENGIDTRDLVLAAHRAGALAHGLIGLPRSGPARSADLDTAVRNSVRLVRPKLRGSDRVVLLLDSRPARVAVPGDVVERALVNLIVNASEAMPGGGAIQVTTGREPGQDGPDHAVITVSDRGPGVPVEQRDRIFKRFVTTKAGGHGLGLAGVRAEVESWGGTVDVTEAVGGGALFRLRLPFREENATPDLASQNRPMGSRVLVVDDDPSLRDLMAKVLTRAGHEVVALESARQARDYPVEGRVDLLVTDVALRRDDGMELARSLQERAPTLMVLVVTGRPEVDEREVGYPVLRKPFRPVDLRDAVMEAIDHHRTRSA